MKKNSFIALILLIVSNGAFSMKASKRLFCKKVKYQNGYAEIDNESEASSEPNEKSAEHAKENFEYESCTDYQKIPQFSLPMDDLSQQLDLTNKENSFYRELMKLPSTTREYYAKLDSLAKMVNSVHTMKLFYTHLMIEFRLGNLPYWKDLKIYINRGLDQINKTITCDKSYDIFRLILDKAFEDEIINDHEYQTHENEARCSSFRQQSNTGWPEEGENKAMCIHIPDEHVESVHKYLKKIQGNVLVQGNFLHPAEENFLIKSKENMENRIETGLGIMGVVLNALLFSQESWDYHLEDSSRIDTIVDFGDIKHVRKVVFDKIVYETLDLSSSKAKFLLENAIKERNSMKLIAIIAAVTKHREMKNHRTLPQADVGQDVPQSTSSCASF